MSVIPLKADIRQASHYVYYVSHHILRQPCRDDIVVQQAGMLKSREKTMDRLVVSVVVAAMLASVGPAFSDPVAETPDTLIIQAKDHAELTEKWCAADPNVEHIFVLPASLFIDSQQLICDGGPYKLYRIIEHDDPDDYEYFLDPPFGNTTRLGCDGKAGRTMQTIAVNCRPLKSDED